MITETAGVISGADQGPFDVSGQQHQFTALSPDTDYAVHVIAQNTGGYNARVIDQRTTAIAPVLNVPAITSVEVSAITIDKPSFSTAGNPAPWVNAYIGLTGSMTVSGKDVTGYLSGPVDVSAQGARFSGLAANTQYTIAVVAGNSGGYSAKTAAQTTSCIAPVLNPLTVSAITSTTITLDKPGFSTAGAPLPTPARRAASARPDRLAPPPHRPPTPAAAASR